MAKWRPIVITSIVWILVLVGIQESVKDKIQADNNQKLLDSLMTPGPGNEPSRGFDYQTNQYIKYNKEPVTKRSFTDEEIRQLRAEHPEYIIKLRDRNVPSAKHDFEDKMEEYIEDNHDEIIERYRD